MDKSVVSPIFIGRAHELARLLQHLEAARAGEGRAMLIAGDAGIGKSRLLNELSRLAIAHNWRVLRGACFEQDTAYPFSLWLDVLHGYLATESPAAARAAFGPFASDMSRLLPELDVALPDSSAQVAPEIERRRLVEAITYFVTHLARTQPLVLIAEDVHWSDTTSLDLLHFLLRRSTNLPIFLLISYRRQDATQPLHHFIAQIDREHRCEEISLRSLTIAETATMIATILDAKLPLHSQLVTQIYTYTEGNPLFVEEILKLHLSTSPRSDGNPLDLKRPPHSGEAQREPALHSDLQIPRSVLDTVRQRSAHLSPAAQQMLAYAAVIGRRFDLTLLATLLNLTERDLVPLLKEVMATHLVREETTEQFTFHHALMREALYTSLLRRERKQMHQQIAETMASLFAAIEERHLEQLAYHTFEAGMWSQALDYSLRAGQQAQSLYAAREAIIHYSRALEATSQMAQMPPPSIFCARGKAHEIAGEFDLARADYEQALSHAQQLGDGQIEWQALNALGFLWASQNYTRSGDYFQRALTLARHVNHPLLIAHSLNRIGNWYANVADLPLALRAHNEALALFAETTDARGLAETYDLMGMAHQLNSDLHHAYQAYQQAITHWQSIQDRVGLAATLACLPLCTASYLKNLDFPAIPLSEAIDAAETAQRIALSLNWRAGEAFAGQMLAMCLGSQGEYGRALEVAHASLRCAEDIDHSQWIVGAHMALGAIYLDLLNNAAARQHLEQALSFAKTTGSQVWIGTSVAYLAIAYVAAGDFALARRHLQEHLSPDTPMQLQTQRLAWFAQAEVELATNNALAAEQITRRLIESAPAPADHTIPRLSFLLGRSLASQGKITDALASLQVAYQSAVAQNLRPQQWRIQVAIGKLFQSLGQRIEAMAAFTTAHTLLQTLAATLSNDTSRQPFLTQAQATFPRPSLPTPIQRAKQQAGGLTAREREIARLVAQGKSNQEISDSLFVGIRTVEAHVTRILAKLDFTSRVQIAAWAIEHLHKS